MAIVLPKFPNRYTPATRSLPRRLEPTISLNLLSLQQALEPGEILEFEYAVNRIPAEKIDSLEASVLWYTEGKGGEDLGVHFFKRFSRSELSGTSINQPRRLSTVLLPASPLSYSGKLIKLNWCVRVRLFMQAGQELTIQRPFYLGHVTVEV